jgi:hypothetical protein
MGDNRLQVEKYFDDFMQMIFAGKRPNAAAVQAMRSCFYAGATAALALAIESETPEKTLRAMLDELEAYAGSRASEIPPV